MTIPIAEKGYNITGLDNSRPMLIEAKRKAKIKRLHIEWVNMDCRDFSLNKKFAFIFFPFNSIAHLQSIEDFEACFSCVKKHLAENGKFIIDIFNPKFSILERNSNSRYPVTEYTPHKNKNAVVITENNFYDKASQINKIKWYYKIGNQIEELLVEYNMRILFPKELDTLLYYNDFKIIEKYGNFDCSKFVSSSSKQLIVCNKK